MLYRFLLLLLLLCGLPIGSTIAQTTAQNSDKTPASTVATAFTWGFRGGVNMGSVVAPIEDGATAKLQILPAAGVFCYLPIGKRWFLLPELLYSRKGAGFSQPFREGIATFDVPQLGWVDFPAPYRSYNINGHIDLHYLEMPLQMAFRYGKRSNSELTFGIQIAYLLAGEGYTQQDLKIGKLLYSISQPLPRNLLIGAQSIDIDPFDPFNTTYADTTIYISEYLKKIDYGLTLGGNYRLYKGLHLGLRCSGSLMSIFRKEIAELNDNFLNLFMQVTVAYKL